MARTCRVGGTDRNQNDQQGWGVRGDGRDSSRSNNRANNVDEGNRDNAREVESSPVRMNNAGTESYSRASSSSTSTNHHNVHQRDHSNPRAERHPSRRWNHRHDRNYDNRPSMHHGNHRARSSYRGRETQRGRDERRGHHYSPRERHDHYPTRDDGGFHSRRDGGAQPRRPAIGNLRREREFIQEQTQMEETRRQFIQERTQVEEETAAELTAVRDGTAAPAPALTMNSSDNAGVTGAASWGGDDLVDSDDGSTAKAGARGAKRPASSSNSSTKSAKKKKVVVEEEEEERIVDYVYSEEHLMTMYTPKIIDHSMAAKKLLVQWDKTDCSISGSLCRSWIGFGDFVFPGLAKAYFKKLIRSGGSNDNQESLSDLMQSFRNRAVAEKLNSTIKEFDVEEGLDLAEIDFCCFMCKCECTDDIMKRTVQNCEEGRKFHRACCHGFRKVEDLDGFSSAAGHAQNKFLGLIPVEEDITEIDQASLDEPAKCTAVRVCDGEDCADLNNMNGASVVLSINTGIGGVAVALKQLGVSTKKIIHVEDDPVIQHVIRYNHDFRYGETPVDDGIEHIVGLYNDLDELLVDPADIIKRWGAIDLIICASRGKNADEHRKYAERFFDFCKEVKKVNKDLKDHESLLYLIETHPSTAATCNQSYCACESRFGKDRERAFICNWPLESESFSLTSLRQSLLNVDTSELELALGLQNQYTKSVAVLFNELKAALTVGFLRKKWSEVLHPKYWSFLRLGPSGHSFKLDPNRDPNASLIDAMKLEIREPLSSMLLCEEAYSKQILTGSMSVRWLLAILTPLVQTRKSRNTNDAIQADNNEIETEFNGNPDYDLNQEAENSGPRQDNRVGIKEEGDSTDDDHLFGDIDPLSFDL